MTDSTADLPSRAVYGGALGALRHRDYALVFTGSFVSSIGTWMQNVALLVIAERLTGKAWFAGVLVFAQLGPQLLVAPLGGLIADRFDRRRVMMIAASVQAVLSAVLAIGTAGESVSRPLLIAVTAGIGIAGSVNAPASNALLPSLVGIGDLRSAIALNSAQMNASRVIGPTLGLLFSPSTTFAINSLSFLAVIAAVASCHADGRPRRSGEVESARRRLVGGIRAAAASPIASSVLRTIAPYSLFSLIVIYQLPRMAVRQFDMASGDASLAMSAFGIGAAFGALVVGRYGPNHSPTRTARVALAVFAAALVAISLAHAPLNGLLLAALVGASYFTVVTTLVTALQEAISDETRGRIMSLWMMAWAGLVPVGALLGGPVIDRVGTAPVLWFGAAVALALIPGVHLGSGEPST